jgi:hypothetical protein
VSGFVGILNLDGNTYMNYLLDFSLRRCEFDTLSRVANEIPARRVQLADKTVRRV